MKTENLIARALRLIQVIDPLQGVKAQDMESGIMALNAMMTRIEADGTALGWANVSNPSDDVPIPPEAEQAIAYNLAVVLAPEWGVTPMPSVMGGAAAGMEALLRDVAVATPIQPILDAPVPQNRYGRGGALNGADWYVG